jgi:vacuolar-type H+-ATPase subunit F/Vma7
VARVVALGELAAVQAFALGGAVVVAADGDEEVRAAWEGLADDVAVVIVTARAAAALGPHRRHCRQHLVVVMPP